jgi:hypothetical protein
MPVLLNFKGCVAVLNRKCGLLNMLLPELLSFSVIVCLWSMSARNHVAVVYYYTLLYIITLIIRPPTMYYYRQKAGNVLVP